MREPLARVALTCLLLGAQAQSAAAERIVSIGGAATEILFALGVDAQVIAVDSTSLFPAAADALPDVGYLRQLSAEPILAQRPDLVLYEADAGPPEALAHLAAAGVPLVRILDEPSPAGVAAKIRAVAAAVGQVAEGERLAQALEREMRALGTELATYSVRPAVLFALQIDAGAVLAAGRGTAADAIIALAGGRNVADFDGYKPMAGEALMVAAPDYVLTMDRAVTGFTPPQAALALPVLAHTPAAAAGRLVVMDGLLLLGFGPRLGLAARELAAALHPFE